MKWNDGIFNVRQFPDEPLSMLSCLAALSKPNPTRYYPAEMIRVTDEVSIDYEIMKLVRASADHPMYRPGFIFENVSSEEAPDPETTRYPISVVAGMYGTEERMSHILDWCFEGEKDFCRSVPAWRKYQYALERKMYESVRIKPMEDDLQAYYPFEYDLLDLPICLHNERDGGRFITGGVQIVWDPEFECYVSGIHRMKVVDSETLGCLATGERRIGRAIMKWHERGHPAPIITLIGAAPCDVLASQAKVSHETDKYVVADRFVSTQYKRIFAGWNPKCADLPDHLHLIPVDSEFVILGFVPLDKADRPNLINDNPFGEFPGTYSFSNTSAAWRVDVHEVLARSDAPLYQTMTTGFPVLEDHILCGTANVPYLFDILKRACSEVIDISLGKEGNYVFDAHVSIKKRMSGEARNVILAALSTVTIKSVWIYDDDIDVHNPRDRQFAWNTRFQPAIDTISIGHPLVGSSLDPSCPVFRHTTKIGFDCTKPLGQEERYKKAIWPKNEMEVYTKKLTDYITDWEA
jgi:2,5-furandicarboxylate decarboxylase 1